jgi:hypothetical protein
VCGYSFIVMVVVVMCFLFEEMEMCDGDLQIKLHSMAF